MQFIPQNTLKRKIRGCYLKKNKNNQSRPEKKRVCNLTNESLIFTLGFKGGKLGTVYTGWTVFTVGSTSCPVAI